MDITTASAENIAVLDRAHALLHQRYALSDHHHWDEMTNWPAGKATQLCGLLGTVLLKPEQLTREELEFIYEASLVAHRLADPPQSVSAVRSAAAFRELLG